MHKLKKVFILTTFLLITAQSNYATYSQTTYNQGLNNTNDEDAFIKQSHDRMNQIMQSNRGMISQDRNMIKEGYDPNESYYGGEANNIQGSYRSYPNQEETIRGQYQGDYNQSEYFPNYNKNVTPQNYPINYPNYPNAPRNDNQQKKQGNSIDKMTSYESYQSNQQYQYVANDTHDTSSTSSINHGASNGVSNTDTNASWDTTDDQTMRQSSANTSQSPRWNARNQ